MTQRAVYKNDVLDAALVMLKGYFSVDKTADTFLYLLFFNRGVAFVNGFCLSRYRKEGPQSSLYVPANLLKNGENTVEVFETEGFKELVVTFKNYIDLG